MVDAGELALTPAYRPGQLLETVPGLVVTVHSGEGKANQYCDAWFQPGSRYGSGNLSSMGSRSIEPSHAHGQGYTDLNFLTRSWRAVCSYTQRHVLCAQGDFSGVEARCISPTLNTIPGMGCR